MKRLERLRGIKNRMVRLDTRVETVRLGKQAERDLCQLTCRLSLGYAGAVRGAACATT